MKKIDQNFEGTDLNPNKGKEIMPRKQIPNTPFIAIEIEEQWYITWAGCILSTPQKTAEDCKKYLETNMWDVIAVFTLSLTEQTKTIAQQLTNQK